MNDSKKHLRMDMRRRLCAQTSDARPITAALERWLNAHPDATTLAVFSAMPEEPDLAEIVRIHPERRWVYPRVAGSQLVFHWVRDPASEFTTGVFGIREPNPDLPVMVATEIDAFFCPGLAFDSRGGRLGRGKGFYDRILAEARPEALKIGICFPCQIVADTHSQAHDMPMDEVICG